MMKKGLVSVSFRQTQPKELIGLVKKSGLKCMEWGGDIHVPHGDLETAQNVRDMMDAAGLETVSYGSYYKCNPKEICFEKVLATAEVLGAKVIRVWAGNKNYEEATKAEREQVYEDLRMCVEQASHKGITVATEMHGGTLTNCLEGTEAMLANVPGLKTYWQPLRRPAEEELHIISTLGKSIIASHIFYWIEYERYPLADNREGVGVYLNALREHTDIQYALLEFVKDDSHEQFLADAETFLGIE